MKARNHIRGCCQNFHHKSSMKFIKFVSRSREMCIEYKNICNKMVIYK